MFPNQAFHAKCEHQHFSHFGYFDSLDHPPCSDKPQNLGFLRKLIFDFWGGGSLTPSGAARGRFTSPCASKDEEILHNERH